MAAGIVFGCVVPHPPVLLPEVGHDMAREVEPTVQALQDLGRTIASYEPQTLVLISPHGPLLRDSMAIGLAPRAEGDFANFQAPDVRVTAACDVELAAAIREACGRVAIAVTPVDGYTRPDAEGQVYALDHGAAVPLHFLLPLLGEVRVVLLGYSWQPRATHLAFGQRIRQVCEESGKRVVYVASGDLSHRLTRTAPAGYDPQGQVFDEEVVAGLAAGDWQRIQDLPAELVERAGVCGYNSILTLAGAVGAQVESRVLCYQGPFGVGYVVAEVEPRGAAGAWEASAEADAAQPSPSLPHRAGGGTESAAVQLEQAFAFDDAPLGEQILRLARSSLQAYVHLGRPLRLPEETISALGQRQACFVTLREHGQLRGCVGTIEPTRENLAQEIADNAVGAGTRDFRFLPVTAGELGDLAYSVDVLSPLEGVRDISGLDPAVDGMVVRQGGRVGVLLPGIPEVKDAQQQFEICCQKAGISSPAGIELARFSVTRYAEPGAEH
jgi:MEMO1 family protein